MKSVGNGTIGPLSEEGRTEKELDTIVYRSEFGLV